MIRRLRSWQARGRAPTPQNIVEGIEMTHRKHSSIALLIALLAACGLLAACSDGGGEPAPAKAKPETAKAKPEATPEKPQAAAPSAPAKPETKPAAEPAAASPAELAQRGRQVYMANCIACHNQDPSVDGALGPAVAGSSRELVEARVLRAEYPEGYTPKRPSKVMIALPHLSGEIDALTAYLASQG
jgi:mono/diheme cytochrome c family protein